MTAPQGLHVRVTARVGALRLEVELDTGPGTLVVVGPNGAGKSSLLLQILGVLPVLDGRVSVGAEVLLDTSAHVEIPIERRRLGYVPQDYGLFPHLSVRGNVEFGLRSALPGVGRAERAARVERLIDDLGLQGHRDRRTDALSGGEKQRVALARALSVAPRGLLLDEPLAALDVHTRREVRAFLAAWLDKLALPTIIVTHDAADARALGRQIAVLEAGRLTQVGTWTQLCDRPGSRFVEAFVASGV